MPPLCPAKSGGRFLPRLIAPLILALAAATPSASQPAALEAARGIDRMGNPSYEFDGRQGASYACTAFDADGAALATAEATAGLVAFPTLHGAAIIRVTCRET